MAAIFIACFAMSSSVHEFSHAYAAHLLGDDTAKVRGRMTLNPFKHIDPWGFLCMLLARFGWAKPVPFNPARFRRNINMKFGTFLVALAGPLSNIILTIVSIIILKIFMPFLSSFPPRAASFIDTFLMGMIDVNGCLAVFNLVPIPPLDGSKILGALLPQRLWARVLDYEYYGQFILLIELQTPRFNLFLYTSQLKLGMIIDFLIPGHNIFV
jgi:Zn-dependent protease